MDLVSSRLERARRLRLPIAMPSAATIRIAATAKVMRMPVATASGCAVVTSVVRRRERENRAHDRRAGDQPEVARQVEHAGDDAALIRRHDPP